jgi:hypothetical protein
MAVTNKRPNTNSAEIEALLPWHAAGSLDARDARRVDDALAQDRQLARRYDAIREERAETVLLNERLGAPSPRAMQRLFAAIDAEPPRGAVAPARVPMGKAATAWLASLSPPSLAKAAAIGALVVLAQAGAIGAMLIQRDAGPSQGGSSAISVSVRPEATRLMVRFVPSAQLAEINMVLDHYQAVIVESGRDGLFRLQFAGEPMTPDQIAVLIRRLESESIVSAALRAQ